MSRKSDTRHSRGSRLLHNSETMRQAQALAKKRFGRRRQQPPDRLVLGENGREPEDDPEDEPEDNDSCRVSPDLEPPPEPDNRTVHLIGPVDGNLVFRVAHQLYTCEDSGEPVSVLITSPGGSLDCGLAIYDHLRAIRQPIVTVVFGCANSIATIILQAGHYRLISPNASIQVHNAFVELEGDFDFLRLKEIQQEMAETQRQLERILAKATGQSRAVVREWCQSRRKFTARQAIKAGLVDRLNRR